MDTETALLLVRPLADGVNPFTGEALPQTEIYQQPQMIRAMAFAVTILEQEELRSRRRRELPQKAGLPWSDADDEALTRDFDAGLALPELAKAHERTRGAIEARLVKLGKLDSGNQRFT